MKFHKDRFWDQRYINDLHFSGRDGIKIQYADDTTLNLKVCQLCDVEVNAFNIVNNANNINVSLT